MNQTEYLLTEILAELKLTNSHLLTLGAYGK